MSSVRHWIVRTALLLALETANATTTTPNPFDVLELPESHVVNITFIDTDWVVDQIGGLVSWLPPSDLTNVTHYAVYLAPNVTDNENTREQVDDDVAVGTNSMLIPAGTQVEDNRFILVYTSGADGRQNLSSFLRFEDVQQPLVQVTSLSFVDADVDAGELEGLVSWTSPASSTASLTICRLYLAEGAGGENATLLAEVPANVTSVFLPVNTPLAGASFLVVFTANNRLEAAVPAALAILDAAVPASGALGVSGVQFADDDLVAGFLEGTVAWDPPVDAASVLSYNVYLSSGRDQFLVGSTLVGTHQFVVPAGTAKASYSHFAVYAQNGDGEQRVPARLLISDAGLSFVDADLREDLVGGNVSWVPIGAPTRVRVYLADGPMASASRREVALDMRSVTLPAPEQLAQLLMTVDENLTLMGDLVRPSPVGDVVVAMAGMVALDDAGLLGMPLKAANLSSQATPLEIIFGFEVPGGAARFDIPFGTALQPLSYVHVAPEDAGGTTFAQFVGTLSDRVVPAEAPQHLHFADQDLERAKIGGVIRWSPPSVARFVANFSVFLSMDPPGAGGAEGLADAILLAEVDAETNNATVPLGTRAFTWGLVFAGSVDGLQPQPATVRLYDLVVYEPLRRRIRDAICTAANASYAA